MLIEVLGHYGELLENIVEELFDDGGTGDTSTEGTNRTGTLTSPWTHSKLRARGFPLKNLSKF